MLEPTSSPLLVAALIGLLGLAVATDIDQRKISNKLVVVGLVIGVVGHAGLGGFGALALAFAGVLVGFLCLLPFYAAGGMGAGDVKLMAMCGAFLGPVYAFIAVVASLVVASLILGRLVIASLIGIRLFGIRRSLGVVGSLLGFL